MSSQRIRVIHFVTGGFSGATQVAIDLARAQAQGTEFEPLLVLRRKRSTDPERVQRLRDSGLALEIVPGWSHLATLWALARLCRRFQPHVMVAHGFPEHLLGRWASLWAGVPRRVHVEHNSRERYTRWRLWQARKLAARTDAIVGVSEGVAGALLRLGMPPELVQAIPNGVDVDKFASADEHPMAARAPDVVMSARFARQKDHPTLIRALALLRDEHELTPTLHLAGSGREHHQQEAQRLVERLGLGGQVKFLGYEPQVARLLMRNRVFVLSTRWEGMPLALVEAMAAGCACVATLVPGVEGVLEHEKTGLLVPPEDPALLAAALRRLLTDPLLCARLGHAARQQALQAHGLPLMRQRYDALLRRLI